MLGESHDLFHEFPEYKDRIAELKAADPKFAGLYDEYHTVNDEVERIEPVSYTHLDVYKRQADSSLASCCRSSASSVLRP